MSQSRQTFSEIYRNLSRFLRPYRFQVIGVVCLMLIASVLDGLSHSLIIPVIQSFASGSQTPAGSGTFGVFSVYTEWLSGFSLAQRLQILSLALLGLFTLKNLIQYGQHAASTWIWLRVGTYIRQQVLANTLRFRYQFFLDRKQGRLLRDLFTEPYANAYVLQILTERVAGFLSMLALITVLLFLSWQMTLAVFGLSLVFGLGIRRLSAWARSVGHEQREVEQAAMAILAETISGIRQVKMFSAESRIESAYSSLMRRFFRNRLRGDLAVGFPPRVIEVFWIAVLCLFLFLPAALFSDRLDQRLPLLAMFMIIAFRIAPHVSAMSNGWLQLQEYLPAIYVVNSLLEADLAEQPGRPADSAEPIPFTLLKHQIAFEEVRFAYPGKPEILRGVSATFHQGEITAVVGPSGAGKTTLVDLLVRLFEPQHGRITVDGIGLGQYDLRSWRDQIGFVSQDTFIFHGTIWENIAFSRPEASREEIVEAARLANAHSFILELPEGYETVVGDRGLKLSGGQRQRVAIARAVLRDPQILIFDEATSALDALSEQLVQQAIREISRDRTVVVIAHRLSTILNANKMIVLDRGVAVEQGTHDSLLANHGIYWRLYEGRKVPTVSG